MNRYSVALFSHFLSLLVACTAAALSMLAAVRLRRAESAVEAGSWLRLVRSVVRLFPLAVLGLVASGAYMTHERWSWSLPWVQAGLAGLALIVVLGSGIEASRGRELGRELEARGLSTRACRLLRDPMGWSARMMTQTIALAVVFVMTTKPGAGGAAGALAAAVVGGLAAAVPFWRASPDRQAAVSASRAASPGARPGRAPETRPLPARPGGPRATRTTPRSSRGRTSHGPA